MISYLEGTVKFKGLNYLILLTHGVGYKVFVPTSILSAFPLNSPLNLYTHMNVKEDALDLYGFEGLQDLQLYELLIGVSGIGPKTALAVFSYAKPEKIKGAITKGDFEFFTAVPRLGKKNAQKIIIELRSKLGSLEELDLNDDGVGEQKEIIDALQSFGFTSLEAKEAMRGLPEDSTSVSEKIRLALKNLGKKK